jgi:hypothetical protein
MSHSLHRPDLAAGRDPLGRMPTVQMPALPSQRTVQSPPVPFVHDDATAAAQAWDRRAEAAATEAQRLAGVDLRDQLLWSLREMNVRHLAHAWDSRHSRADAIAPHAVAFLFSAQTQPQPLRYRLYRATRTLLDGEEVRHLPTLLHDLWKVATAMREAAGAVDPRDMANRVPALPEWAECIGVAVSTLDTLAEVDGEGRRRTHTGAWADVLAAGTSLTNIGGRCFAYLCDGAMVLTHRRGELDYGQFTFQQGWFTDAHQPELVDQHVGEIWRWLIALGQTILYPLQEAPNGP